MVPDDVIRMKQHLSSLTTESPYSSIEYQIQRPDGTTRWQRWNNRAIFSQDGLVSQYQSVGQDITDRKMAEDALMQSEEQERILIDHIQD